MTRTDELTETLLNGGLSSSESAELEALVAASDEAGVGFSDTLRMEASLRGLRHLPDQGTAVVEQIHRSREQRAVNRIMSHVRGRRTASRSRRTAVAVGILTAAIAMSAAAFWLSQRTTPPPLEKATRSVPRFVAPEFAVPSTDGIQHRDMAKESTRPVVRPVAELRAPSSVTTIFEQDYEGDPLVTGLARGVVTECPPRPGSTLCAQGALSKYSGRAWYVAQILNIAWTPDTVIEFDYWVAAESTLHVLVFSPGRNQNYAKELSNVTIGTWAHAVFRANDLVGVREPQVIAPGDTLENVTITGGRVPDGPLYIDNIRVTASAR